MLEEVSKNTWVDKDFPNYKVEKSYSIDNNIDVYRVWFSDLIRAAFIICDGSEYYSIEDIRDKIFIPAKEAIELKLKDLNEEDD
jgi:hypothetical protein